MSTFSTFGEFREVRAEYSPQTQMIRVEVGNANLVFFLDSAQAVTLRDDLSRAIAEQAQKAAQATAEAAESEGAQA